jgi:hypothetical protein
MTVGRTSTVLIRRTNRRAMLAVAVVVGYVLASSACASMAPLRDDYGPALGVRAAGCAVAAGTALMKIKGARQVSTASDSARWSAQRSGLGRFATMAGSA